MNISIEPFEIFTSEDRETMMRPFHDNVNYYSTNGHAFLMLPMDDYKIEHIQNGDTFNSPKPLSLIPTERNCETVMNVKSLAERLSEWKVKDSQECHECDGRGVVECNLGHEHNCGECDTTGEIHKENYLVIHDTLFTKRMFEKIVKAAQVIGVDTIKWVLRRDDKSNMFELGPYGLVIMPCHKAATLETLKEGGEKPYDLLKAERV